VSERFRVLVLGGYGHFGGRISRALAADPAIDLIVAGRDAARAESFAAPLGARAAAIDHRSADFPQRLAAIRPALLIHTAGPFQGQDYSVAEGCIAAGAHYVDLADGRAFVCGIERLDVRARERGVLVVSGASTLPAVSSAIVDGLRGAVPGLDGIEISIAPAQRIPRGEATLAAVLTYCGRPFTRLEDGRWHTVRGWQSIRRHAYRRLGTRWMAACDVPDLDLFPRRYPGVKTVTFDAALELWPLQWGMWLMAAASRIGLVRDWSRHAGRLQRLAAWFDRFGSDVGGMQVKLRGPRGGVDCEVTAPAGQGPEIPALPAIILARKLAADGLGARGATACVGLFSLDEFRQAAAPLGLGWRTEEQPLE
jgi:uncharacterized protein YbjT (DUF2867 family)